MERLIAIIAVALGTYLARVLPFYLSDRINIESAEKYLSGSSVAIISALFVTSFFSTEPDVSKYLTNTIALIFIALVYSRTKNAGVSIMLGVIIHFTILSVSKLF
ncbi:AzlD domain-containing protein [Geoglobus acetivorans]|uniref:Branched-chain amino acid transport n=1 Tax=Geoglobus acetivorans TaxID=565033 RepID=A0A0A7GF98_GEOAI|nr:hypothetical protein GACE_0584 [Geoglobus acetivorans]